MKQFFIILLISFLVGQAHASGTASSDHYCDDAQEWKKWTDLVAKYPTDDNLASAYALRIGLCEQIKDGTIETDRAINLFERFFDALKDITIKEDRKQKQRNKGNDI